MRKDRNAQKLKRRSTGFFKAPREIFYLLADKKVTTEEFVLLEFIIAMTDWDNSHESFGTLETTNQAIADCLGWSSDSTSGRHIKSLIKKGLLKRDEYNRLIPKDFDKWLWRKKTAFSQSTNANLESHSADMQSNVAELQGIQSQEGLASLVSSKGNLGLFVDTVEVQNDLSNNKEIIITDEELNYLASRENLFNDR